MASFQASVDLYDMLECAICNERMSEPKVLQCQHTFCTHCLEAWSQHAPARPILQVVCPTCRFPTMLNHVGINSLPSDLKIKKLLGLTSQSEESPHCFVCAHGVGKQRTIAKCYCEECHNYLCKRCGEAHLRASFFKNHHLIHTDAPFSPRESCQEHPMVFKDYYCEECRELVCNVCVTCTHQQHKVHDFQVFFNKCVAKTKQQLEKLDQECPHEPPSDSFLNDITTKTKIIKDKIQLAARMALQQANREIKRQENELIETVERHHALIQKKMKIAVQAKNVRQRSNIGKGNSLKSMHEWEQISQECGVVFQQIGDIRTWYQNGAPLLSAQRDFVYIDFVHADLDPIGPIGKLRKFIIKG